ncbi:hypothetical protein [Mycobacterium sp. E2479]|nr:hypothetical protein [Mycobacterium sp. E2479]
MITRHTYERGAATNVTQRGDAMLDAPVAGVSIARAESEATA